LRLVRSPDAPKMINKHESPTGKGSRENVSSGFTSMTADKEVLPSKMSQIYRCAKKANVSSVSY
jgi:hypothetical protein